MLLKHDLLPETRNLIVEKLQYSIEIGSRFPAAGRMTALLIEVMRDSPASCASRKWTRSNFSNIDAFHIRLKVAVWPADSRSEWRMSCQLKYLGKNQNRKTA